VHTATRNQQLHEQFLLNSLRVTGELYALSLGLSSKQPVAALYELCTKLRWGAPQFEMHEQSLASSDPKFLMKVPYNFYFFNRMNCYSSYSYYLILIYLNLTNIIY
jgi:hypothetical protein